MHKPTLVASSCSQRGDNLVAFPEVASLTGLSVAISCPAGMESMSLFMSFDRTKHSPLNSQNRFHCVLQFVFVMAGMFLVQDVCLMPHPLSEHGPSLDAMRPSR